MSFLFALLVLIAFFLIVHFAWKCLSRYFNTPCPAWLHWLVELENPLAKSNQARHIISGLDLRSGMKVLDVGCGPGRLSIPLAKAVGKSGEVICIDLQAKMLQIVQRKAASRKVSNLTYINIPMGEGKLIKQDADRAVLVTVLGEIPNRELCLREIYGSLKTGGVLAISESIFDPHYQNKQKVLELAIRVGFIEVGFMGNKLAYTVYLRKDWIPSCSFEPGRHSPHPPL